MNKILTIIIPTYNMEKYLHRCLDSLIIDEGGMKQLEVLVINDGSKDSSSQIAHEYQDKYPETFRVIDKENGNYGSCINRGLKEATGKYVKVLDADDSFDTKGFKQYLDLLSRIEVDLIVTDVVEVNPDGKEMRKSVRKISPQSILPISDVIDDFLTPQIQMHAVTYKTQNLRDINYHQTEGISYTDQEWMFMPMTKVETLYYFPVVLYLYLIGREGQTVEFDTHIRNIAHHIKSDFYMLSLLETIHPSHKVYDYLQIRCTSCFTALYYRYLIVRSKMLSMSDLVKIDNRLQKNKVIYQTTMKVSWKHVHYIKIWRKSGASEQLPLIIILLSTTRKMLKYIKKRIWLSIHKINAGLCQ